MAKTAGKPVTLKDIAKVTKLSIPAVSLSLLDNPNSTIKISDVTRERVRRVAAKMGYRPNLVAKSLREGTTQTVGIITFQTASALNYAHIREARPIFSKAGLSSLLHFVEERSEDAFLQACHAMIDARVCGVLLYMGLEQSVPYDFEALKRFGLPIVSVGNPALEGVSRYIADEKQGFQSLTEHLVAEGYRKIGLVSSPLGGMRSEPSRTRSALQGFQAAIKTAAQQGITVDSRVYRLKTPIFDRAIFPVPGLDELYAVGYLAMRNMIDQGNLPEALIFQADGKALGALRACSEAGIRVPQDIAIAGFNDDRSCSAGYVTLTSVALPIQEMTQLAAMNLIRGIARKSNEVSDPEYLPCEVMVRQSTARNPLPLLPVAFDHKPIYDEN